MDEIILLECAVTGRKQFNIFSRTWLAHPSLLRRTCAMYKLKTECVLSLYSTCF